MKNLALPLAAVFVLSSIVFVLVLIDHIGDIRNELQKTKSDLDRARQMNVDFIKERDQFLNRMDRLKKGEN